MRKAAAIGLALDYTDISYHKAASEKDVAFFESELFRLGYKVVPVETNDKRPKTSAKNQSKITKALSAFVNLWKS